MLLTFPCIVLIYVLRPSEQVKYRVLQMFPYLACAVS